MRVLAKIRRTADTMQHDPRRLRQCRIRTASQAAQYRSGICRLHVQHQHLRRSKMVPRRRRNRLRMERRHIHRTNSPHLLLETQQRTARHKHETTNHHSHESHQEPEIQVTSSSRPASKSNRSTSRRSSPPEHRAKMQRSSKQNWRSQRKTLTRRKKKKSV